MEEKYKKRRTRQDGSPEPGPSGLGEATERRRKIPPPNLAAMHAEFNKRYFDGGLHSFVIQWSNSQTSCSGITFRDRRLISISRPILGDPRMDRSELVNTVLHEMIHAHLFIEGHDEDSVNHGPRFRHHMRRINEAGGHRITVDHAAAARVVPRYGWMCSKCRTEKFMSRHASPSTTDRRHPCRGHVWLPLPTTT